MRIRWMEAGWRVAFGLAGLITTQPASAAYIFSLDTLINGVAPSEVDASKPYLTATVKSLSTGEVELTLDASNLAGTGFIGGWLFNIDPSIATINVVFDTLHSTLPSSVLTGTSYVADSWSGGSNVKGGLFDIQFAYNTKGDATRFTGGNVIVLDIFAPSITDASFNFLSVSGGPSQGTGGYYTVADVQGSGSVGATSVVDPPDRNTIPEPGTLALLGMSGLAGLAVARRRQGSSPALRAQ